MLPDWASGHRSNVAQDKLKFTANVQTHFYAMWLNHMTIRALEKHFLQKNSGILSLGMGKFVLCTELVSLYNAIHKYIQY